ncbi:Hypothetical predicted protein [Xyrichtys novacula]|uniref:Uncharacterized protein n=1 Tax=Xyrichtys novacula TaxID=13765 RepID=A0AAV1G4F8_XYRNO|nr:Hypothetical predicted protein [Xyrichtys novacula]
MKVQTASPPPPNGLFPLPSIAILAAHIITMHPESAKRDRAGKRSCTRANAAEPQPCSGLCSRRFQITQIHAAALRSICLSADSASAVLRCRVYHQITARGGQETRTQVTSCRVSFISSR